MKSSILHNNILRICLLFVLGISVLGCEEANHALDKVLGRQDWLPETNTVKMQPVALAKSGDSSTYGDKITHESHPESATTHSQSEVQVNSEKIAQANQVEPAGPVNPGEQPPVGTADQLPVKEQPTPQQNPIQQAQSSDVAPPTVTDKPEPPVAPPATPQPQQPAQGKTRRPGSALPGAQQDEQSRNFIMGERDIFAPPSDELPTDCPPSRPLCKYDRSQLKLVGIIQVGDGMFKGLVEDPDGRGYFVSTGMMLGRATIVQVNAGGLLLYDQAANQDVIMPLTREGER